ncbi:MBL fold metallo-hydrolase [Fodinicola acaciae]|uniref:MBL fold metallo-hydrolase n=1 Tax=Fodinicola acaciae TaxID=2681555 RepID=UPI0013D65846|nr:MBL fold metallo-hydrolase [Fodinicola acaciae]
MKLTILGGDGAWPSYGGACSGYLVEHAGFRLLIDPGYGVAARVGAAIDAVYVTHGHPDHCADLNPLLRRIDATEEKPIDVYAPAHALDQVLALDRPGWLESTYDLHEFTPGEAYAIGPFRATTVDLPHFLANAGIRLSAGGETIAYTGDTGPSDRLRELADGVDILLHEASYARTTDSEFLSTARVAGQTAAAAQAKNLILTHLFPTTDREEAMRAATSAYDGPVTIARPS